jgi:hypothetical protein
MSERKTATWQAEIEQALADWRNDRAYIDGRGNYHVKLDGRSSGPVAPWSKTARRAFATVTDLHNASGYVSDY